MRIDKTEMAKYLISEKEYLLDNSVFQYTLKDKKGKSFLLQAKKVNRIKDNPDIILEKKNKNIDYLGFVEQNTIVGGLKRANDGGILVEFEENKPNQYIPPDSITREGSVDVIKLSVLKNNNYTPLEFITEIDSKI